MPTLGVIFPGQGSQSSGMGADAAERYPAAAECFAQASQVLGYDLLVLLNTASADELKETRVSQPAIFTVNVALYRAVESLGCTPIVSAGHSFGEYCSLVIAGALDFDEALRIVNQRGLAMGAAADLVPGTMAAIIGLQEKQVDDICARTRATTNGRVEIGNLNTPEQIVISGDIESVEAACALAKQEGAKRAVILNVSGAWHSELMQPALPRFALAVENAQLRMPSFRVVSNVTAKPYSSLEEIRRCLIASLCARVRWHETARSLAHLEPDIIVECGASQVLAPMMRRLPETGSTSVVHVGDAGGVAKLHDAIAAART
ncbi:MAG: ACP S-malonyltransferase [Candidatus Eremiobacteraeota bacterium]|nr:ACP S-malonyltransferase [Candidatus Eremiobacteraeota bacterium]